LCWPAYAATVFAVGVPYPLCSCKGSVEEFQLPKSVTSRSDGCPVPDATGAAITQEPSQRPEIVCEAQRAGKPPVSLPPTGGIALLIDILAREALKDLMTKRSKGCKPRNLR
jgi:hypothetical protein